jgi:hypothetical protein
MRTKQRENLIHATYGIKILAIYSPEENAACSFRKGNAIWFQDTTAFTGAEI